jgi:alpha/beta superfamily hydrolase
MSTAVPRRDALTLDGPVGRLEALLEEPRDPTGAAVAVFCHPHPQHQGSMLNKVVHTLSRAANKLGAPSVRFNFRGVGASDGEYANGDGEVEDTQAVIAWAQNQYPGARLWLGGFSFGAMVSAATALRDTPDRLISAAPPGPGLRKMLGTRLPDCPWLIVHGDADEVCDCDEVIDYVNEVGPGPELMILPDVDHYFHGRLTILRDAAEAFLGRARP